MNLNGKEDNKAFKAAQFRFEPYYYIVARLNLAGLESNDVYYFNKENNLAYMDSRKTPFVDEYGKYYLIDEHSVIGEVSIWCNPDCVYGTIPAHIDNVRFSVGGVYRPTVTLNVDNSMDVWGGPTGNTPGAITNAQLQTGQICYYGSTPMEPTPPMPDPENGTRKYLALKIVDTSQVTRIFSKGSVCVCMKVYPKFQV